MARFCSGCGSAVNEGKNFCSICGTKIEAQAPVYSAPVGSQLPAEPQAQPYMQQTFQQPQQNTAQPQYQYQMPVAAKKKSKLPIILLIIGAGLVGIALLVIFVVLPHTMNTMAERDFYTIATNDVPTVKYILGEKRTVTGVSAATRSDGFQEQVVTYESEDGEDPQQDMLIYATALCDEYGFYAINDNDFSKTTGQGFQFAKESIMEGNLVIAQIDYDISGYTVTLLHGEGTLSIP